MEILAPVLFAVFIWWFSTGAILYVDGLPRAQAPWTVIVASCVTALAVAGLAHWATVETPAAAYWAFGCALVCWGWQELTLYSGVITGSRRVAAQDGVTGWRRFVHATQAIIYHEVAIAVMGLALVWLTFGAANQVGVWTYMVLWWMRLSAKLNMFFGVPNHSAEFLPAHIGYLESYFRKRPMNLFFPLSVTVSTLVTAWLFVKAYTAAPGSHAEAGFMLLGTLMALAVIEHWFLVIPLPVTKLWSWGLASRDPADGVGTSIGASNGTATTLPNRAAGNRKRDAAHHISRPDIPMPEPLVVGRSD